MNDNDSYHQHQNHCLNSLSAYCLPVTKCFPRVKSFNSHQETYVITLWLPPFHRWENRLREVKSLAQGHTARKRPSQDLNTDLWGQSQCYNHPINGNEVLHKGEILYPILQKKLRLREVPSSHFLDTYICFWKNKISAKLQLAFLSSTVGHSPRYLPVYGPQHSPPTRK